MARLDYIRDPQEIYRRSFDGIAAEADLAALPPAMRGVAVRLIHACGMTDLAGDLLFSPGAAEAGRQAIANGAAVICDVEMVRSGIIRSRFKAGNDIVCSLNDAGVAEHANASGQTRSAAAVEFWGERLAGAVVAIGNAPTALFRLLELLDDGAPRPALIIGMPVGFVGAAESKAELAANPRGCEFITIRGRRGGSALAAAAVNALATTEN
ncbi:MAG TPA: precorrin-8X methylmutase [Rhizobiaceae bacterium]|nr:precorrin-8X methylmutase [Rhizobiaceae bacterium]